MHFVQDPNPQYSLRAVLINNAGFTLADINKKMDDAKQWCRKNKMMLWHDTAITLRFTSKHDLSWFLLRWS